MSLLLTNPWSSPIAHSPHQLSHSVPFLKEGREGWKGEGGKGGDGERGKEREGRVGKERD